MTYQEEKMGGKLDGKVALVTAAGQGIGRATAVAFADAGANVWATDINEPLLAALSQERPKIQTRRLDVREARDIENYADELGTLDVLFNCAGYVHHGTILDCSEKDWDLSFDINIKSMYRTCRAFLPAMLKAGKGSIINVSSAVSSIRAVPNRFAYGSTKAAVIGLTKAIAADFIRSGVRCNAICPGTVQSPSLEQRIAAQSDVEEARSGFIARQPMGRLGRPEEIAALAVYLASDESTYTTGQVHIIDGGFSL
jgi:2-dehydro-3-deoxy-L-fuconate 4-dehydrogenase